MAESDLTVVRSYHTVETDVEIGTIEGPASYAAGGFVANPGAAVASKGFGLTTVDFATFELLEQGALTALMARYDRSTGRILVYESEAIDLPFAEITDADDISSIEIRYRAEGKR